MAHIEKRVGKTKTTYRAKVFVSEDPVTGKKKGLAKSFDSPEEAAAWAAEKELERKRGTLTEPSRETLAAYGRAWLEEAEDRLKRSTWFGYSDAFRRYIEDPFEGSPHVGRVRMDTLRPEHVQRLYLWLRKERGLSAGTVKGLHSILRQILAEAFETGAIAVDIATRLRRKIPRDRDRKKRAKAMTQEQLDSFLAAASEDRYAALWYLLASTGMRPGEALALTWGDLDMEARKVRIHRTLSRVPGEEAAFTSPKTSGSSRVVALPRSTIQTLKEHRKRQVADRLKAGPKWKDKQGLIFTTTLGGSGDWTNLRTHFDRIMRAAKLGTFGERPDKPEGQPGPGRRRSFKPMLPPYALRHTHATLSLRAGVPIKVVSERLGHASTSFTMDIYSDSLPDMQEAAADAWDLILGEGASG